MSDASGESDSVGQRLRENATGIVSTLVTGIWLGAMFSGQDWWLAAMLVGYVAVVPITAMLFGDNEESEVAKRAKERASEKRERRREKRTDDEEETALEALRRRYAEGELTDEQFERKLEALLETETVEDVEDRARSKSVERER
ncbi:SHOCT domain-containing protein [Halolamina salifodinae]|uniref:Putative membrane protein n=1 Tax=Halolamina salifodinae TaxID=1202767 RepID=A0A8T4GWR4_9EURY|nr:SHOCT domain-containing protein [Halolamina salifodinae]MBP1987561.1 putative membrane protein [Halolamina salifodinae]